jgi:hypothetical protein
MISTKIREIDAMNSSNHVTNTESRPLKKTSVINPPHPKTHSLARGLVTPSSRPVVSASPHQQVYPAD